MKPAEIFKDGMIIQRNKINRIWGEACDGENIILSFLDKTYTAIVENNTWYVDIEPHEAGGPYKLEIKSDISGNMVIDDILFGEVWLAGGQSNMELELQNSDDGKNVCKNENNEFIRFYNVPKYAKVDEKLAELEKETKWKKAKGDNLLDVSAVGFYFAKKLYEKLNVPIGIIDCYWGGTSATCWFSRDKVKNIPKAADYIKEWDDVIMQKSDEQYEAEMKEYDNEYQAWCKRVDDLREKKPGVLWEEINETCGTCPWPQPMGSGSPFRPFGLHESMIKRVAPYGVRGFIYYQGEEDWNKSSYYEELNQAVIDQWREDFSIGEIQTHPFLITQLPMYIAKGEKDVCTFAKIREKQELTFKKDVNSGIAVIIDCGEFDNIHPTDKETPGVRLAYQALGRVYKTENEFDNMYVENVEFSQDKVRVTCANTYGQILYRYVDDKIFTARRKSYEKPAAEAKSGEICGFEISEDGENFKKADVSVDGTEFILSAKDVKEPKYVRYAFTDFGVANVYNKAGFPLAQFRSK